MTVAQVSVEGAHLATFADDFDLEGSEDGAVSVGQVARELEEARRGGARAVLLAVDSLGGDSLAGLVLFGFLRWLSGHGMKVVAYVSGWAGSCAAEFILGADLVVIHPDGRIGLHGARDESADPDEPPEDVAARKRHRDEQAHAIAAARTLAPDRDLERWVGRLSTPDRVEELDARRARDLGFADFIGGRGRALELAQRLARGAQVTSARSLGLARRALERPDLADAVQRATASAPVTLAALRAATDPTEDPRC